MVEQFRDAALRLARGGVRSWLAGLSISLAIGLILLFQGFRLGFELQLRSYPESLPTPLVAVQPGVTRLAAERSSLPGTARIDVESVPGVRAAHPMIGIPLIHSRDGVRTPIFVVAYDSLGGPTGLVSGRPIQGERELVADAALAAKHRLAVGDDVDVLGVSFRLVGLSADQGAMFTRIVYVRYVDLVDLYLSGAFADTSEDAPLLSFLLVDPEPGADLGELRDSIEATVPEVDVRSRAELALANVVLGRDMLGPVLDLLVGIAYAIAGLVIALTSYLSIANRARDLAVMKAIGAPNRLLAADVLAEVAILCALALLFAFGLAGASARVIETSAPDYRIAPWSATGVTNAAIAATLLAIGGGLPPLRSLTALDPAEAFRR